MVPPGWALATLGELTEDTVVQGGPAAAGRFVYVDIGGVDNVAKRIVGPKQIPVSDAPNRARQRLRAMDLLVSMTRPNLNAVALVPTSLDGAIGSTAFHVLRTKAVLPTWLYYTVQTDEFVRAMTAIIQGVLYPAVRPKDVRAHSIPIAPLAEQHRIVAEIDKHFTRLDAAVAALRRARANLKRYRASVLKAACEGRLVPTEAELARRDHRGYETGPVLLERILWDRMARGKRLSSAVYQTTLNDAASNRRTGPYREPDLIDDQEIALPEGWTWVYLDQLLASLRNGTSMVPNADSGRPILRISAVRPMALDINDVRYLSESAESVDTLIEAGDLLFTRYNGSREFVGVCAAVRAVERPTAYPDKLIRGRTASAWISPLYLEVAVNSGASRAAVERRIKTTAGQSGISGSDLRSVPVPLPPYAEQRRIVAEVERRLSVADALDRSIEASLRRAERLRQSILKRAFEGKLMPQDPNDEPANALLERIKRERHAGLASAPRLVPRRERVSPRRQPSLF